MLKTLEMILIKLQLISIYKKKKTLRFSVINYKKKFTISVTKNHNECYNFEHISRKTTYSK